MQKWAVCLVCMVLCFVQTVSAVEVQQVPILMYHHFIEDGAASADVCPVNRFLEHMKALESAGVEPVDFEDLYRFVTGEGALPPRCVVLTADDGYASVLTLAVPVLRQYGFTMSVALIGSKMGDKSGIPHFSMEEYKNRGADCIRLVSHGWDLHRCSTEEWGVLVKSGNLHPRFVQDTARMRVLGETCPGLQKVFVYPYGHCSGDSEKILDSLGYKITVSTRHGIAVLTRGDAECLRLLPRICADGNMTGEDLLSAIGWG